MIFTVPLGAGPEDGLVGYTASGVSVRRGNAVVTYDERGQMVRTVPTFSRQRFENVDAPPFQKHNVPAEVPRGQLEESRPPGTNDPPNRLFPLMAAAVLAILVLSPGLVVIAAVKNLSSASWDTGQSWAFGVACSFVIWLVSYLIWRNFRRASIRYLVLCAGVVLVFLFCHFGLKTEFTAQTLRLYFPAYR